MTRPTRDEVEADVAARLARWRAAVADEKRAEGLVSNARLVVFLAGAAAIWWAASGDHNLLAWLIGVPAAFVALVAWHGRVVERLTAAERGVALYERAEGRLAGDWAGHGSEGPETLHEADVSAHDLDLFGPASVFQWIGPARTTLGEATLARWFVEPTTADEMRARRAAVEELCGARDLCERVGLLGDDVAERLDPEALVAWARAPSDAPSRGSLALAAVLGAAAVVTGVVIWLEIAASPFLLVVMIEIAVSKRRAKARAGWTDAASSACRELTLLADVLEVLETQDFEAPALRGLVERVRIDGERPSVRVRDLDRRVQRVLETERNPWFAPLAGLLQLRPFLEKRVDDARGRIGDAIDTWIEAAGAIDAFATLGTHAFEQHEHLWAEVLDDGPAFDATGLGHPLIASDVCVRNDVALSRDATALLLVSGSNMSGKSTLLRAVGVAVVLARCGAPVRAASLRLSPLTIGASIRIQDSLADGASHFYAEITRLRDIDALTHAEWPVLFLLDEILHGTNSHDRLIGAAAVVRAFVERGAVGLVTTHDLALSKLADELGDAARNVHFEDQLVDGEMVFDYTMRDGVVQRGNALELMRGLGLRV